MNIDSNTSIRGIQIPKLVFGAHGLLLVLKPSHKVWSQLNHTKGLKPLRPLHPRPGRLGLYNIKKKLKENL